MKRGSNSSSTPETGSTPDDTDPKPQPPVDAPQYAVDPLTAQDPDLLRAIGEYAFELADWKQRQEESEIESEEPTKTPDEWVDEEWDEVLDEAYEEVDIPRGKGSVTVNVIDGRGYYYLKGSHNGEFFSQYIAPVEPKERGSN